MVVRELPDGALAIGQPSHAWLSGQLARAWGNERFGAVWTWEEVCLAAEQHDVGMAGWDLEPELDPETGRPRSFMAMALATHLELWSAAPHRLRAQSRYAALLVSHHATARAGERACVERNRALVWTWDTLSLALLLDWAPHDTDPVPTADGPVVLRLSPLEPERGRYAIAPWPFAREGVEVRCEGRRLERRFEDEAAMQEALARARWTTLVFELVPAAP